MTILTWPDQRRSFHHLGRSGVWTISPFALAFFVLFCLQGTSAHVVGAEETSNGSEPVLHMAWPGQPCKVAPADSWSAPEKWAWQRICVGEIADYDQLLNQRLRDTRNPDKDCQPSDHRELNSEFLETILLYEPFRSAIPRRGVRIVGAYFPNDVDLSDARFNSPISIDDSCFESEVNLHRLSTTEHISFDGSRFAAKVDMESASVELELFLGHANFEELDLTNAKFHHLLDMQGSTVVGLVNMESISVGADLELSNADFADFILVHAEIGGKLQMMDSTFASMHLKGSRIGGQINMTNSTLEGILDLDSASVGGDVFMRGDARFESVVLQGADFGDKLAMVGATFQGDLNMNSASVAGHILIRDDTEFNGHASLAFLEVGGNLIVGDAKIRSLDLTGADIKGTLMLGSSEDRIVWEEFHDEQGNGPAPILTLRNTKVGLLQDTRETWPDQLEMEGLVYGGLGGFLRTTEPSPYNRESVWFIGWLAKDRTYSAHPYRHLAGLLSNVGYPDKAGDVLYAGRERERQRLTRCQLEWWWLSLLKYTIGYGYGLRFFRALGWVLVLALAGWLILWISGERTQSHIDRNHQRATLGFWYSLDMVLPFIHLREWHYDDVDLVTGARWCFYLLKIMAFILVFFVIAGLTGLII